MVFCLQTTVPFFLGHGAVDGNGGKVLFHKQVGESDATLDTLDKNDHLKGNVNSISTAFDNCFLPNSLRIKLPANFRIL